MVETEGDSALDKFLCQEYRRNMTNTTVWGTDPSWFASILSSGEGLLILTLVIVLFVSKCIPEIARGLAEGFSRFREQLDREGHDAGKGLAGIYGKPAAEALTEDNRVAELYDPDVFRDKKRTGRTRKIWRLIWDVILKCITR